MSERIRQLEAEHSRLLDEKQRELAAAAAEEFPMGSRVRWIYTFKNAKGSTKATPVYREGVVVGYSAYEVKARMHTGTVHGIYFAQLEAVK